MFFSINFKKSVAIILIALIGLASLGILFSISKETATATGSDYIKWVDFNASYPALKRAMDLDIESHNNSESKVKFNWLEILAYITAENGNDFSGFKLKEIDALVQKLESGESMQSLTKNMKYYDYYLDIYTAVLGEYVGNFSLQTLTRHGTFEFKEQYGLKAYSPIADGYYYEHFDDFGNSRNYGYNRKHLGHDMMASIGTPIIATEGGIVEEMGWNQYGGWRLGIRSFDGKRYYYYAHLRQNRPYHVDIKKGGTVTAGDVIGYMGRTGYSTTENVNNITTNHLHFGIQLIFDESQKDENEIWIDLYALTKLLEHHKSTVVRNNDTKEYYRKYDAIIEPNDLTASLSTDTTEEKADIPVLMYHTILNHPKAGNKYEITVSGFEQDLKYLKENGYETVVVQDLIDYVDSGVALPEKAVMLTFDDGNYNNIYYGEELLEKYGFNAVLSVVGQYSENSSLTGDINPNYSYLTWEQIEETSKKGIFELQNHTWDMHSNTGSCRMGAGKNPNESDDEFAQAFTQDITKLQEKLEMCTGKRPLAFTYPFGFVSDGTTALLKNMGFRASFSCREGIAEIRRGDPESLFRIKRFLRCPKSSAENILSKSL